MLKTLTSLLPYAIALTALGCALWWALGREMTLGPWLLAAFLAAHGLVHALFVVPRPTTADAGDSSPEWPFDTSRSWLVTDAGLDAGLARRLGVVLVCVVAVGFVLAALATVDVVVPVGWWPALVVGSAIASAVLLVLYFSTELVLGLAIDAVLVWVVLGSVWVPAVAASRS